jgi:hypothetical protein
MKTIFFPATGKYRTIAEASDVEAIEHMQYVAYFSEISQKKHLSTIKGGILLFSTLNPANYFDRVLIDYGFKALSIFIKADPI